MAMSHNRIAPVTRRAVIAIPRRDGVRGTRVAKKNAARMLRHVRAARLRSPEGATKKVISGLRRVTVSARRESGQWRMKVPE